MKRWLKVLITVLVAVVVVLLTAIPAHIRNINRPPAGQDEPGYTPPQPLVYTELPTELAAEKVGSLDREVTNTASGLIYKEEDLYGTITLDGQVDTGAIYVYCEAKSGYFIVTKTEADTADVTTANVVGLVDATGKVIIPLRYASVELLGERFARVAELTGRTENKEEKLTQFVEDGETVMCSGNWYIYDLKTGKKVPGATGTKPYICFDCGGYVKYVTDDKVAVVATPDGTALPEEPIHLKNGHYALPSNYTVYDSEGNQKFTYDPNGYIPVDSGDVSGYIVGEKKVGGKSTYVLFDLEGNVASAEFTTKPVQYGELFHVGQSLVKVDGTPVVEAGCERVFWESAYGQCWAINDGKTTKVVDKTGNVMCENKPDESMVDTNNMLCYATGDTTRAYYCFDEKAFSIQGVALSPFVIKRPAENSCYELVNALTGEVILSGAQDYKVTLVNSVLYVYAKNDVNSADIYVVR